MFDITPGAIDALVGLRLWRVLAVLQLFHQTLHILHPVFRHHQNRILGGHHHHVLRAHHRRQQLRGVDEAAFGIDEDAVTFQCVVVATLVGNLPDRIPAADI
ncbi:hypothetical protein D3C72_2029300 [compost metagenome]